MRRFVFYNSSSGLDSDAQAFLIATGITDDNIKTAIDTLVKELKVNNIWIKMKAIYPFVGGTASTHKYNLKDARDLDAAFRLIFNGGGTHSVDGYLPNGTNGYADTNFNFVTEAIDKNNFSTGFYVNNNNNQGIDFGADVSPGLTYFYICARASIIGNKAAFNVDRLASTLDSDSLGFYIGNKILTTRKLFKNSIEIATSTASDNGKNFENYNATLGALNRGGTISFYTLKRYAFLFISDGLTDLEISNLNTIVQAFQTTLSRNV